MEKDTYLVLRVTRAERDAYDAPISYGLRSEHSPVLLKPEKLALDLMAWGLD